MASEFDETKLSPPRARLFLIIKFLLFIFLALFFCKEKPKNNAYGVLDL